MNKLFLSGVIVEDPVVHTGRDGTLHLALTLCVSHRNRLGQYKQECYTVHAWRAVARWAMDNLTKGQKVLAQGYLTQRPAAEGEGAGARLTEVAAEEFFVGTALARRPLAMRGVTVTPVAPAYPPMTGEDEQMDEQTEELTNEQDEQYEEEKEYETRMG